MIQVRWSFPESLYLKQGDAYQLVLHFIYGLMCSPKVPVWDCGLTVAGLRSTCKPDVQDWPHAALWLLISM